MSKRCAKCEKAVYPIEELKCLDKTWHKACFRCWECGMTLNMKNYKGYDKKPYCSAHYPTTKFTQVAITPELARIAQNTKLQSQVQYHEEFEKSKGHYTVVTDDPETKRLVENTRKNSLVKYHEEYEKMKGTKQSVVDDPELLRHKQNTSIVSNVEYWGLKGRHAEQEYKRGLVDKDGLPQTQMRPPGGHPQGHPEDAVASPYSSKNQGNSVIYSSQGKVESDQQARNVGSIADYDPMNNQFGSITGQKASSNSYGREWVDEVPASHHGRTEQPHYPPANPHHAGQQYRQADMRPPQEQAPPPPPQNNPLANAVYQAMYDYESKDHDEVGFEEGDIIINPEPIDEGWMYGTVKRTGQTGMLPANYVQRIQ